MNICKIIFGLFVMGSLLSLTSCKETDETFDPYYNWKSRNAAWFELAADSARTAIAAAKAQSKATYGTSDKWEEFTNWRMFRSLMRAQDVQGPTTDSIVCKILTAGTGTYSATFNDTVRLHYRLWTMPTEYEQTDGHRETKMAVASQTFYGNFDSRTAAPVDMPVNGTVEGFQIALQYMVEGDDWMIYIPQQLAYKKEESEAIPAYSTLLYRVIVAGVYEGGSGIPAWKTKRQ